MLHEEALKNLSSDLYSEQIKPAIAYYCEFWTELPNMGMNESRRMKTSYIAAVVLILLLMTTSVSIFSSARLFASADQSSNLSPTDDAYVVADLNDPSDLEGLRTLKTSNLNFLKIWYAWENITSPVTGNLTLVKIVSLAFLKFNLGSLNVKNISSAQLMLYASTVSLTGASRLLDAYLVTNNTWTQQNLDFDNNPGFDNNTYAYTSVSSANQWYSFDVTQMARQQLTSGELSIAITFSLLFEGNEEQVVFNSTRAPVNLQPKLVVTYPGSGALGSIVSFVSTSPGIFIVPVAIAAGGAGGIILYVETRRKGSISRGPRKSPKPSTTEAEVEEGAGPEAVLAATSVAPAGGAKGGSSSLEGLQCPNCGKSVQADFSLCPFCGTQLPRKCVKCGKEVRSDFALCPYCGTKLN